MPERQHRYVVKTVWTGNHGSGTSDYRGYGRAHTIVADGKPDLLGSSDPAFLGDQSRWNPEELFVASLSACHKLWYLSLCAGAGVTVTAYEDAAEGVMTEAANGSGRFTAVTLKPRVTITTASDPDQAAALHRAAHAMCFIARSVNFPVAVMPTILSERP